MLKKTVLRIYSNGRNGKEWKFSTSSVVISWKSTFFCFISSHDNKINVELTKGKILKNLKKKCLLIFPSLCLRLSFVTQCYIDLDLTSKDNLTTICSTKKKQIFHTHKNLSKTTPIERKNFLFFFLYCFFSKLTRISGPYG